MTELGLAANNSVHEVDVGQWVIVWLPESGSTGHRWALHTADLDVVAIDTSKFRQGPGRPAGVGDRGVTITARRAGSTTVELKRWRPWEGEASVDIRFALRIIARD